MDTDTDTDTRQIRIRIRIHMFRGLFGSNFYALKNGQNLPVLTRKLSLFEGKFFVLPRKLIVNQGKIKIFILLQPKTTLNQGKLIFLGLDNEIDPDSGKNRFFFIDTKIDHESGTINFLVMDTKSASNTDMFRLRSRIRIRFRIRIRLGYVSGYGFHYCPL